MNENNALQVLVIDDDPTLIKMLEKCLEGKGYKVQVSQDAPQGLQEAMINHPDLIVLDVMMPVINGYNICRLLKDEEATKDIPIILLTSRDAREDVAIGMDMGADAYLIKPVDTNELFKMIELLSSNKNVQ